VGFVAMELNLPRMIRDMANGSITDMVSKIQVTRSSFEHGIPEWRQT